MYRDWKKIDFEIPEASAVLNQFGGSVQICSGRARGLLHLAAYNSKHEEDSTIRLMFDFLDAQGKPWRYQREFMAFQFWFEDGEISVAGLEPDFKPIGVTTLVDTRNYYCLRFSETGEVLRNKLHYTLATISVDLQESDFVTHIKWSYSDPKKPDQGPEFVAGTQRMPYSRFLFTAGFSDMADLDAYDTPRMFVHLVPLGEIPSALIACGNSPIYTNRR